METNSVISQIGNTPLVRLKQASELTGCNIYGKAEYFNPGESVKDRAALFIVQDTLKKKLISKDRFFQTEIKIFSRKLKFKEVPITYVCKTHHIKSFAIFESIYLLFKIRFIKNNYFEYR